MERGEQVLIAADSDTIVQLIQSAGQRLVILAPAVSMDVAKAIRERWFELGAGKVMVTLDVDPEVYRLGYGDPEALTLLEATGREVGSLLQYHPGVRIGVVLADESVLVYSPVPALIEAGPRQPSQPTGLLMREPLPALSDALGVGPSGVCAQEVGLDKATLSDIVDVQQDLKANPPQKFDVTRTLRVFNAAFQFVEFSVKGTQIHRRKVRIPSYLLGVTDARMRRELTTALQIVPEHHELSGDALKCKRNRIEKRWLKVVPGYGYAVLRSNKAAFVRDVEDLKAEVRKFRSMVEAKLQVELTQRVEQLTDALLPRLNESPPAEWIVPDDAGRRNEAIRRSLQEDLLRALGTVGEYAGDMTVKLIFRDVTYESLNDPEFREAATKAFPQLQQRLHEQFDAAPAAARRPQSA
jgi:hypothetical protein